MRPLDHESNMLFTQPLSTATKFGKKSAHTPLVWFWFKVTFYDRLHHITTVTERELFLVTARLAQDAKFCSQILGSPASTHLLDLLISV